MGRKGQFELGQWLGRRYRSVFHQKYDEKSVKILSSQITRTIESAKLVLQGIYNNATNDVKMEIIPQRDDNLVRSNKTCTKRKELVKELLKTKEYSRILNSDLFAYLRNETKFPIYDFNTAYIIYDTLMVQSTHNLTLPEWTNGVYPDKLHEMAFYFYLLEIWTFELMRLKIGLLWNEILNFFRRYISNPDASPKVFLISGHEYNLINLLYSIGAYDNSTPSYSSCLLFELHRTNSDRFYVETFFKTATDFVQIKMKNCDVKCDLQVLVQNLKPLLLTPKEWEDECKSFDSPYLVFITTGVLVFALLMCTITYCFCRRYSKRISKRAQYEKCSQKDTS